MTSWTSSPGRSEFLPKTTQPSSVSGGSTEKVSQDFGGYLSIFEFARNLLMVKNNYEVCRMDQGMWFRNGANLKGRARNVNNR